ncbi:MAG: DMT family transporter [Alphaproteobacteria bacterium]|nr:MAG: DMT family transporter [Alphaproteobacteria bacterium]
MDRSEPLKAALWMTGAILSFTALAVAGREAAAELDTFELMFYRSGLGLVIVVGMIALSGRGFAQLRTAHPRLHGLRNLVHFVGQNAWFYAVAAIPLSQLTALEFSYPIWVALLAPLLLGERLTRIRALAALLGFLGVLVVARPGVAPVEWGHGAGLLAALGFALSAIFTRRIMRHDSVPCVLFWMSLTQAVAALALALPGGIPWPSPAVMGWVVVTAVAGLTAHFSLTSALSWAPAAVVAPMEFGRLPVIAVVGMLVYGEPIELAVVLGALLIVAGNLLNLRDEQRRRRNIAA